MQYVVMSSIRYIAIDYYCVSAVTAQQQQATVECRFLFDSISLIMQSIFYPFEWWDNCTCSEKLQKIWEIGGQTSEVGPKNVKKINNWGPEEWECSKLLDEGSQENCLPDIPFLGPKNNKGDRNICPEGRIAMNRRWNGE